MATGGNQGMVASGNQRLGPATSTSAVGMKLLDHINPPHTPQGVSVGMHSTVQTGVYTINSYNIVNISGLFDICSITFYLLL